MKKSLNKKNRSKKNPSKIKPIFRILTFLAISIVSFSLAFHFISSLKKNILGVKYIAQNMSYSEQQTACLANGGTCSQSSGDYCGCTFSSNQSPTSTQSEPTQNPSEQQNNTQPTTTVSIAPHSNITVSYEEQKIRCQKDGGSCANSSGDYCGCTFKLQEYKQQPIVSKTPSGNTNDEKATSQIVTEIPLKQQEAICKASGGTCTGTYELCECQGYNTTISDAEYKKIKEKWEEEAKEYGINISEKNSSTTFINPVFASFPSIEGELIVSSNESDEKIDLKEKKSLLLLRASEFNAITSDGYQLAISKDDKDKVNKAISIITGIEVTNEGESLLLEHNNIKFESSYPLTFDMTTKVFSLITKDGSQTLTVMPYQAIDNLIKDKIIDQAQSTVDNPFILKEYKNKPAYEIKGLNEQKLLGIIPVNLSKTIFFSATEGNIIETEQNIFNRLVDSISF